jgi:AcrR family transcriptional regulator
MGRQVSATRQRILDIAAELFATHGYDRTGVAMLSEATGLGRGALYYHIKSKESLLFEISTVYLREMLDIARTVAKSNIPPDEKLRSISSSHMKIMADHPLEWTTFFREMNALTPVHRELVVALRDEYEQIWQSVFAEGVAKGKFRDLDPMVAKVMLGSYNYTYVWLHRDGRLPVEKVGDIFFDVFCHGLCNDHGEP